MTAAAFLSHCLDAGLGLIALALLLCLIRLWRGPSLADRLVALDMMTTALIGFAALFALRSDNPAWLDIALALALTGFVAVVAFARYAARLERRQDGRGDKDG